MRRLLLLGVLPLLLAATSSGPVVPARETADQALARARAEANAAERRAAVLEAAAERAGDAEAKLRADQAAAVAAIDAAEARITAADAAYAKARTEVLRLEERLAQRRAPVAGLLAGIATMGRQPPLLALADGTSVDELVRVRALLDTTMPVIARRSAALSSELREGQRLAAAAETARGELAAGRRVLAERRERFAALERRAAEATQRLASRAFAEQDRVIAGGEDVALLGNAAQAAAAARANARKLALLDFAPPRPGQVDAPSAPASERPPRYMLPADALVIDGLGSVSSAGVRSRGIQLATRRGATLSVPADGRIVFAGPYRDHDGVVIIDHGRGWVTLLLNVATPLKKGRDVRHGEELGTALGDISVELRLFGQPRSAALIAGSSALLSNGGKIR